MENNKTEKNAANETVKGIHDGQSGESRTSEAAEIIDTIADNPELDTALEDTAEVIGEL